MNNKYLVGALVIIALLVSGLYFKGGSNLLGGGTRMQNGISADNTSPVAGEVRGTTLTITSTSAFTGLVSAVTGAFSGLVTLNGGQLRSNTLATTTTDTATTMVLADFNGYDTILMTPNTNTLTLTFPASSTIPTFLPAAGDMQETCWLNSTTTAAKSIVFAASAGIDLQVATSTAQTGAFDLTIAPQGTACFKFIRKKATAAAFDIEANLVEYENAD